MEDDQRCTDATGIMQGPAAQGDSYYVNKLGTIVEACSTEAGCSPTKSERFRATRMLPTRGARCLFHAGALFKFGKGLIAAHPDRDGAAPERRPIWR